MSAEIIKAHSFLCFSYRTKMIGRVALIFFLDLSKVEKK